MDRRNACHGQGTLETRPFLRVHVRINNKSQPGGAHRFCFYPSVFDHVVLIVFVLVFVVVIIIMTTASAISRRYSFSDGMKGKGMTH